MFRTRTERRSDDSFQTCKQRNYIPELDRWVTLRVAASTIRTIDKIGIYKYLTDLEKKGLITIVEEND